MRIKSCFYLLLCTRDTTHFLACSWTGWILYSLPCIWWHIKWASHKIKNFKSNEITTSQFISSISTIISSITAAPAVHTQTVITCDLPRGAGQWCSYSRIRVRRIAQAGVKYVTFNAFVSNFFKRFPCFWHRRSVYIIICINIGQNLETNALMHVTV